MTPDEILDKLFLVERSAKLFPEDAGRATERAQLLGALARLDYSLYRVASVAGARGALREITR